MAYFRCMNNVISPVEKKQIAYLKWQITKLRGNPPSSGSLQISEFYFFLKDEKYEWKSNVSITSNMAGYSSTYEIDKLIDDNINTKYNTPDWGNVQTNECNIIINLGEMITIDYRSGYSFCVSEDEPSRDPISWKLYGSIDGINWEELDSRTDETSVPTIRKKETMVYRTNLKEGGSDDYLEILKGTNNPSNNDGVDGQVYLKYVDYNSYSSLYDFKEYIEVGSTEGAYINTGIPCTSDAYFEVDFNWTDTHNQSRVFGCGTGGGAMFLIQNYNTDYIAVGSNNITITDGLNRHVYKANNNGIYVDGILLSNDVNWNNALPSRHYNIFAIDWDNVPYYAINTKIYSVKIWGNGSLAHHFVPVERKSDNEAGMLDIITGVFYDNDGTQSFTVGGTPSVIFDYPITQAYSKINSIWQNLIGTDVRKIMSGQKYNYVITGTFITASTSDTKVDVYCGFEPDIVYVEMEFGNGITKAIGYNGMNHSMWDLTPIENNCYSVEIGSSAQTGISDFTSTGFKYNAHAGNTLNKNCTFCAVKLNPSTVDDYVTLKKVYMRVYPGQETSGDNLQFSDDGVNWDVTVNYQQCNPRSNAVIVKDVLQVYYESPNWYIACASLFAKDENNNNYRMYDVMWYHHYNGIQPANFTGWIPNFLDE